MLESAFLVPSEVPPNLLTLKQALLGFSSVVVPDPSDRDLIPEHTYPLASGMTGGLPLFAMKTGPVRPLGKTPGYDDEFSALLDSLKAARDQGLVRVLDPPAPAQTGLTIGKVEIPEDRGDPRWVYGIYRHLSEHPAWVMRATAGIEASTVREAPDLLVPASADQGRMKQYVDGKLVSQSSPLAAAVPEDASDEEALLIAGLAHARIGSVVRSLAIAEAQGMTPLASQLGVADVLSELNNDLFSAVTMAADPELETFARRVHSITVHRHIDIERLNAMNVSDLISLRTEAWGRHNEHRAEFFRVVAEIAAAAKDDADFDERVENLIADYHLSAAEVEAEKDGIIRSAVSRAASGTAIGMAISAISGAPAGALALIAAGEAVKEAVAALRQATKAHDQFTKADAYAVVHPYAFAM